MEQVFFNKELDKESWGAGPWSEEPDKIQWVDETTNLDCLIVRGPLGALCGYVGVPSNHDLYQVYYGDIPEYLDVHGGVNFSNSCQPHGTDPSQGICHIPEPGRSDHVWWLGFDCSHCQDYLPSTFRDPNLDKLRHEYTYRDVDYVKQQCTNLAIQLAEFSRDKQSEMTIDIE
jgi:hypothetical protein